MKNYYGLLPAAGLATRMRPFRYPKELLPVHYHDVKEDDYLRPKLLIEHSLEAFSLASVKNLYIVVPEWKPEIMRYLEDGEQFGHHISYLYNSKALGLADALLSGYPWLHDKITCFAMPDTVFSPPTAFRDILGALESTGADLVLGVFPTDEPQQFAPVEFDDNRKVISVVDKPSFSALQNTWGIAVWNEKFWDFFKTQSENLEPGISISYTFDKAAKNGLKVQCIYFDDGWYKDIGRINNITFKNA